MSTDEHAGGPLRRAVLAGTLLLVLGTLLAGYLAMRSGSGGRMDEFMRHSQTGKNYYDKGDAAKAVGAFEKALALLPNHTNAILNLANACLRANQPDRTLTLARRALELDPSSGPAHYLAGCAALRLGQFTNAVQSLQQAKQIDRTINAISFQLGRALQQLGQWEPALEQLQEVVQFEPEHPAAHYNLSQVLLRLNRTEEAQQALDAHQKLSAARPAQITDPSVFEQCIYTQARVPFKLEQPHPQGTPVTFADATAELFGELASTLQGPTALLDLIHDGRLSLLARNKAGHFVWLTNAQGRLQLAGEPLPPGGDGPFHQCLVGDLNNDRVEDILILGDAGTRVLKFTTNGTITDISLFCRAQGITGRQGLLADLDFTGKLSLIAVGGATNTTRVFRNLGQPYFMEVTTNAGWPAAYLGAAQVAADDWNGDDLLDVFVARPGQPPQLFIKQRGGPLALTNTPAHWPSAQCLALGDLNNDLTTDLVLGAAEHITVLRQNYDKPHTLPAPKFTPRQLLLTDYDNDGWLDLLAAGSGLRLWRNRGESGWSETTSGARLEPCRDWSIREIVPGDLDADGDTDLLVTLDNGEIKWLRNDGGNSHRQLKVHLVGTKSNSSGLGIRLEITAGGLRLNRRVQALPIEIGVGQNANVDSLTAHWFDFSLNTVDVAVDPNKPVSLMELQINTGSCPYLYAWNGTRFEFVTDLLGASPLGLRLSENRFIDADPFEYVWLGDAQRFPARDGRHVVQITEELREVLYLDEAKLVVVDHPPGTEVHPTCKLLPAKPFPTPDFVTLHRRHLLRHALTHQGQDVTDLLQETDGRKLSPARLRAAQLRGLAEPHHVTLDFGPLPVDRPLVLALTGWLRFGGGMANVSASHNPDLPFPFPTLEAESADGRWTPVPVQVGAPAGKTKTIIVDLAGRLPPGSKRLRLATAFEIHWDRIALWEKAEEKTTKRHHLAADRSDLHWRGFSALRELPWHEPLTPDYPLVHSTPEWRINPSGWCTRYGPVDELIQNTDNALVLLNAGDELTLEFQADRLPPAPPESQRDFFLWVVGWDKDSDFHCELGWQVDPLPWHGMNDQRYGHEPRPAFPNDDWMHRYNTRWVGPRTLVRRP